MLLAEVIIEYPSNNLDRPFYYAYEQDDLKSGVRVLVPFALKKIIGYVLSVTKLNCSIQEIEQVKGYQIKYIDKVIDQTSIVDEELFLLAKKVAKYYFAPLINILQIMLPPSLKPNSSSLSKPKIAYEKYLVPVLNDALKLTPKQKEVYLSIINKGKVKKSELPI